MCIHPDEAKDIYFPEKKEPTFEDLQDKVWIEYKKNGYLDMWGLAKWILSNVSVCKECNFLEISLPIDPSTVNHDLPRRVCPRCEIFMDKKDMGAIVDLAEAGLVTTEVSEALEAIRKGNRINEEEEWSDAIIRIMNYAKRRGFDIPRAILEKHEVNMKREKRHGKLA